MRPRRCYPQLISLPPFIAAFMPPLPPAFVIPLPAADSRCRVHSAARARRLAVSVPRAQVVAARVVTRRRCGRMWAYSLPPRPNMPTTPASPDPCEENACGFALRPPPPSCSASASRTHPVPRLPMPYPPPSARRRVPSVSNSMTYAFIKRQTCGNGPRGPSGVFANVGYRIVSM